MTVERLGELIVNSSFTNVKSCSDTILGYPEVSYGYNLEDQLFGKEQSEKLIFPMNYSIILFFQS